MEDNWVQYYANLKLIKEMDSKVNKEIYELFRQDHFLGKKFCKPLMREIGRGTKNSLDIPFLREHGICGVEQIIDIDYPNCQSKKGTFNNIKENDDSDRVPAGQNCAEGRKYDIYADNITNSVVINGNNSGNITIGDAVKRQNDAVVKINFEIHQNFMELAGRILSIECLKPEPFWDIRKVNETEQNYQTRAENSFLKYKERLTSEIAENKYSRNIYLSYKNEIIDKNLLEKLEHIYSHFDEVVYYMHSYDKHLNHLLSLSIDDKRRHQNCLSKHNEVLTDLKIHVLESAAYYFTIFNDDAEGTEVLLSLAVANICIEAVPVQNAYLQCRRKIAEYESAKAEILRERILTDKNSRHVDSNIHDPYIIMLRKTVGLSEVLSEAEISNLKKLVIDTEEKDPLKLFKLAAHSYIELDGEASVIYFQRILELSDIAYIHRSFAEVSLHRLRNPDFYQGALGVIVLDINTNGGLHRAGAKTGDVIISINGQPLLEPLDLSMALASEKAGTPILLKLVCNETYRTIILNAGEPAGAVLSQLVIYSLFQL